MEIQTQCGNKKVDEPTIKASELRIGNWIVDCNGPVCVPRKVSGYLLDHIEKYGDMFLSPIPLTPEVLEKCGFVKVTDGGILFWQFIVKDIAPNSSNEYMISGMQYNEAKPIIVAFCVNDFWASGNIKYLHQLQNLYFALTGTELEINL